MDFKPTQATLPDYRHWPLTTEDIIRERVNYEDRVRFQHEIPGELSIECFPEQDMRLWSPAALHIFAKQAYRFLYAALP